MLNGDVFRLKLDISGLRVHDNRAAVTIPAGEIVRILSGTRSNDQRKVQVLWHNQKLLLFVEDLKQRGEEVRSQSAT